MVLPSKADQNYIQSKANVRTPSCNDSFTPKMNGNKKRMFSPIEARAKNRGFFDDQDNVKSTGAQQRYCLVSGTSEEAGEMYGSIERDLSKPNLQESNQTDLKGNFDVSTHHSS